MPRLVLVSSRAEPTDIEPLLKRWGLKDIWDHHYVPWERIRAFLKDVAFHKANAEIIEVGTTWVSGLFGMNALRPFSDGEVSQIQREGNFLPIAWKNSMPQQDNKTWSIPWSADVRIVYYWKDMFDAAKVDPETAFRDPEHFEAALEQLRAHGFHTPWVDSTAPDGNAVFRAAMWIWQQGGRYISEDGRRVMFTEPAAIEGLCQYFSLRRFTPETDNLLGEEDMVDMFNQRQAACVISGQWLVNNILLNPAIAPLSLLGAALPPVPPMIGGTHLVVMEHLPAQYAQSAVELITRLTSQEFAIAYSATTGFHFPMRADLLSLPQFTQNPFIEVLFRALQIGRTLPAAVRWGIVEDGLIHEFTNILADMKARPDQPLESIIRSRLEPLAKRLNRTLAV